MKYAAGVVSGVLITVFGQWALAAAPDVEAAFAHMSTFWAWAHEAAADRMWWLVALLGVPALLAVCAAVIAGRQALAAALSTVVATA